MGIYITIEGKENGPYVEDEARHFLNTGDFLADDLARREGESQLRPLGQILAQTTAKTVPATPLGGKPGAGIYITVEGKENGPYEESEVRHFLSTGDFLADDLARRDGESERKPLATLLATPRVARAINPPNGLSRPTGRPEASRIKDSTSKVQNSNGPSGVGGWLLVFCVTLVILFPLLTLMQMLPIFQHSRAVFKTAPGLRNSVYLSVLLNLVLTGMGIYVGAAIWGGDPDGRRLARRFLVAKVLIQVLGGALCLGILGKVPLSIKEIMTAETIKGCLIAIVAFGVWWSYFEKSVRVRNTYGPD